MDLTIVQKISIWVIPILFAITLHEVAHGWVASLFGDQTARLSGRLSLNPLKHVDPIGTVILPILMLLFSNIIFGWAKPVPVDPRNLHHRRRDMIFVALAGPLSNFLMAVIWGLMERIGLSLEQSGNVWLGTPLAYMGEAGITINVVLAVLNLIPLPPLDGAKVLSSLLPRRAAYYYDQLEPYGFIILVLLILTGLLSNIMVPLVYFFIYIIEKLFFLM